MYAIQEWEIIVIRHPILMPFSTWSHQHAKKKGGEMRGGANKSEHVRGLLPVIISNHLPATSYNQAEGDTWQAS